MNLRSLKDGRLGTILLVLGIALILNSAYIAAYGDPNLFYVANALLHPVLGILAAILLVVFILRHRELNRDVWGKGVVAVLALAAGFGGYLAVVGMTRPHSLALYVHVTAAVAGLALLLGYWRAKLGFKQGKWKIENGRSADVEAPASNFQFPVASFDARAWRWLAGAGVAAVIFYGAVAVYHRVRPNPQYMVKNALTAPTSMYGEGGGKDSLFFPSSARTTDGKPITSKFFMDSKSCEQCHADIYRQWHSSMHHFASFNNQWYRKAIEYMQDTVGIKPSMWCSGCHDHALALADLMQKHPIREIEFTPQAQNGLGCMSCHAIVHVQNTMGNGGFVMGYPPLDKLASSKNPIMKALHTYAVYLDPKPHRNAFLKPFHKDSAQTPEFCSACHKVHLDYPVNHYRWIRGFDDYDNWQGSGVSGNSARSFYYPPKPQQCQDCHMPMVRSNDAGNINGYVHSHRFVAANTAVPTSYGDTQQVKDVEKFLKGAVTVDVFGIAEEPKGQSELPVSSALFGGAPQSSTMFAVGEESARGQEAPMITAAPPAKLQAPLGRVNAVLHRGETARVEVVVRTRRVGHFFPGGTVDAFDCWVELKAVDDKGHVIYWSGEAASNGTGPVDPGAHFYRSLSLDEHGNWINKRNAWAAHATVYARLIPPGAADTVHFRIKIPKDCGDKITFTAKLNYRKFDWWNTQWAFAGVRDPNQKDRETTKDYDNARWLFDGSLATVSAKYKKIPDVPTVVMSESTATVPVEAASSQPFEQNVELNSQDWERWNDYGIGLLLQGDLKGAARAFEIVTKIDPKYADGWVNVARALVQEGNTDAAIPYLKTALGLDPKLASAYFFMGQVYETKGDYPQAYAQYSKAGKLHPGDRVVSNAAGHILFLERKYAEAVKQFQHTLSIDPENLQAHYNLMLCYRGLEDSKNSDHEEKLYMRFKANEIARAITGPYMLENPADNNESLPIHEHVSINDEPAADFKFYWAYGQRWDWMPGQDGQKQTAALARRSEYARGGRERHEEKQAPALARRKGLRPQADHPVTADFEKQKSPRGD
jgi:tetratricopeptide (TPR) repeat protein